jgi:hypothetical protein
VSMVIKSRFFARGDSGARAQLTQRQKAKGKREKGR